MFVCNCRPLCIVSSTYGDSKLDFFWQLGDWSNADRCPYEAGSTDELTSGEKDDRVMTGGLHSVRSAGCHSLVDSGAWVPARVIPIRVQNRDRGLRTQHNSEQPGADKMGIELGTVLELGSDFGEEE